MKDRRVVKTHVVVLFRAGARMEFESPHTQKELDEIFKQPGEFIHWDLYEKANEIDTAHVRVCKKDVMAYTVFEKNETAILTVEPGIIRPMVKS